MLELYRQEEDMKLLKVDRSTLVFEGNGVKYEVLVKRDYTVVLRTAPGEQAYFTRFVGIRMKGGPTISSDYPAGPKQIQEMKEIYCRMKQACGDNMVALTLLGASAKHLAKCMPRGK